MDVSQAIAQRRSIRGYTGEDVSEADIEAILDSGRWAPSGLNNQPWRFRVLRGADKDSICGFTKYSRIIEEAPACIAVFMDEKDCYSRDKDLQAVGACIQNMLLRIHELGLGGVWLGEILNQKEKVAEALGVDCELMAVIALGHPSEAVREPDRKGLKELII
jgi:nitroreductase